MAKNYNLPLHQYQPAFYSGAKVRSSEINMEYNSTTANYTLVMNQTGNVGNSDSLLEVTANSVTVTLPSATNAWGMGFTVKNTGAGTVTLATTGGQTIDGASTQSLSQYTALQVVSNGTNWLLI